MTNTQRTLAIGLTVATNAETPLSQEDGWLLLAPYGETPYWQGGPGAGGRQFRQVFTAEQAGKMVGAFNALAMKKRDHFRGLPIYAGHPDADPQRWPDERRLGSVTGLEARGDGLYARAAWNDVGEKNRAEGYLVYPSPAWLYDRAAAEASGVIAPDELRSVGLTNTPRLPDAAAWTNSEAKISEADTAAERRGYSTELNPSMNYKQLLLEHFGLPEEAADEDIRRAHAAIAPALEAAREEARRYRSEAAEAHLDAAVNAGRLSAAEREGFAARFAADFEGARRELGERRLALNTQGLGLRPLGAGRDLGTAHGRAAAFNARLDELMRPLAAGGRGLKFEEAITHMRAGGKDAALLRAMEGK